MFWIHQTGRNDDPQCRAACGGNWYGLHCEEPVAAVSGDGPVRCQTWRRYPIMRTPIEGGPCQLKCLVEPCTQPPAGDYWLCPVGAFTHFIMADEIQPVEVLRDHPPDRWPLPINLDTLQSGTYRKPSSEWPSSNNAMSCKGPLNPVPCAEGYGVLRWHRPLLRVSGFAGLYLRLRFVGSVPWAQRDHPNLNLSIFRLATGMVDVQSWWWEGYELNGDGSLWQHDPQMPESWCRQQSVDFEVWYQLVTCDLVIDMWTVTAADDSLPIPGYPLSDFYPICVGPDLTIVEAELWPERPE